MGYLLNSYNIRTKEDLMAAREEIMHRAIEECSGFFMQLLQDLSHVEREGLLAAIRFKPLGKIKDNLYKKSLVRDSKGSKVFSEIFERFLHDYWGDLTEEKIPTRRDIQFAQKFFLVGLTGAFFCIFFGTFALLSSALLLGTFMFGFGILLFLITFMFFRDERYSYPHILKSTFKED
jgi:hypothetical protein